MRCNLIWY